LHYNSKHSTPVKRSMKARLAGIGVAGAATILGGVATANTARAGSVWDAVAACESGGNWAINTGNGFYGGLQFTHSTWVGYGGGAFASNANLASRDQQIAIAQKVLAGQGPGAWPVCSVKAGLTRASGGASTVAAAPVAAPVAAPQVSRSTTRTAPKAVAPRVVAPKAVAPKAIAPKAPVKEAAPQAAPVTAGQAFTVKAGDTLSELAARFDVKGGWEALFAANKDVVANANLIFVGQHLHLPAS